jgi:hypothetical protein
VAVGTAGLGAVLPGVTPWEVATGPGTWAGVLGGIVYGAESGF